MHSLVPLVIPQFFIVEGRGQQTPTDVPSGQVLMGLSEIGSPHSDLVERNDERSQSLKAEGWFLPVWLNG